MEIYESTVTVNPGDILIGDINGVVCIPKNLAQKTLEIMRILAKIEDEMTAAMMDGLSMTEASKFRGNFRVPA